MKWKIVLCISVLCILSFLCGYGFGVFKVLGPSEVNNTPISKGDYYANFINIFVVIGTFIAVVVALFMEEIRSLFKKVSFDIKLESDDVIEDVENIKGTKKAKRYHNSVLITNKGNINARNCELYLESANYFADKTSDASETLNVENAPINWNKDSNLVYIPYEGKKILFLFEIFAPQKQSTPDGKTDVVPGILKILGLDEIEAKAGRWELVYCLNSINSKPQKFKFIVEWNGDWEGRQTEMKNNLTMKLGLI